jgi:ElaB/YqjD/DUF883 family membrane-anchored ribosome-binding protein
MVTANQVLTKESYLSSDDKTKTRERAEKIFREAVSSTKAAMEQVERDVREVARPPEGKKK